MKENINLEKSTTYEYNNFAHLKLYHPQHNSFGQFSAQIQIFNYNHL